jgi:nucleotide-binding universal stress UspA family protein
MALRIAKRCGADLTLLHIDPMPGAAALSVEPIYIAPQTFDILRKRHDKMVDERMDSLHDDLAEKTTDITITRVRRQTNTVTGIVEYAEEGGYDLMVMGSRGLSGAARFVLGSTAEKVSRVAPCPVLIVRDTDESPSGEFGSILVGVDYSKFSAAVGRLASALLKKGGSVELVHVWYPPHISALNVSLGGGTPDIAEAVASGRTAQAELLAQFREELGIEASNHHYVTTGSPAKGLLDRALEIGADLIVVGAHSRNSIGERVIGTVADRVLRNSDLPVLLLPERALEAWGKAQ